MTPQLTDRGANALLTKPTPVPVLYVVWFRPGKGSRWRKAGRYSTHAEAIAAIGGPGDWHVAPLYDAGLAGNGLFDAHEDGEGDRPADAKPATFPAATTGHRDAQTSASG